MTFNLMPETRLKASKVIMSVIIFGFIGQFLLNSGGVNTAVNMRLVVMKTSMLLPALYLIWMSLFGTGRSVRLSGYIVFLVIAEPLISKSMIGDALQHTVPLPHAPATFGLLTLTLIAITLTINRKAKTLS